MDLYLGEEKELYKNCIYKLEDDLFKSLNSIREKPKETPDDKIITIIVSSGIIIFFISIGTSIYAADLHGVTATSLLMFSYFPTEGQMQVLGVSILIFGLMILVLIIFPYLQYKRRKLSQLL